MPSLRRLARTCVLVPKELCERLALLRKESLPTETGGYLIGRRRGRHIEVTNATTQGTQDIATRISFERVDNSHAVQAVDEWNKDRGFSGVVGDWHSHPIGTGVASAMDEQAWRTLARAEHKAIAGLIFGEKTMSVYLAVPRWASFSISRCVLIEETDSDFAFGLAPR